MSRANPNDSNYLLRVLRLTKRIYNSGVHRESVVGSLCRDVELSEGLHEDLRAANINLNRLRIDIYVKHQVAIEVQGEQHVKAIRFSNSQLHPEEHLERQKLRDEMKQRALREAGIPLVCIWYDEVNELNQDILVAKIAAAQAEIDNTIPKKKHSRTTPRAWHIHRETAEARQNRLTKARKFRRQSYINSKKYFERLKNHD